MRVLIIGGTGLISQPLTRQLIAAGHEVVHFNRGKSGTAPADVRTITGDRTNGTSFAAAMEQEGGWDAVIDMVCYQGQEAEQLIHTFHGRTGHLVVCSTVDVYAKPASRYPITEAEAYGPPNSYGRGKMQCEQILLQASSAQLPITIIRAGHIYGPGTGHRGHILNPFGASTAIIDRLQRGLPVIVHGDGNSFWTSLYCDDIAEVFVTALGRREQVAGRAYHVTGDEWFTWNSYFQSVAKAVGGPEPNLVHIPTDVLTMLEPKRAASLLDNFQFNNIFDNSSARKALDFRYRHDLEAGLKKTIAYLRDHGGFTAAEEDPWYDKLLSLWDAATIDMRRAALPR